MKVWAVCAVRDLDAKPLIDAVVFAERVGGAHASATAGRRFRIATGPTGARGRGQALRPTGEVVATTISLARLLRTS